MWSKQHHRDAQDVWLKNSLGGARCLECVPWFHGSIALGSIPSITYTQTQSFVSGECSEGYLALQIISNQREKMVSKQCLCIADVITCMFTMMNMGTLFG